MPLKVPTDIFSQKNNTPVSIIEMESPCHLIQYSNYDNNK